MPEHCIEYISIIEWKKHFDRAYDTDSIDDVSWICEEAKKRGEKYGIEGIDYKLTLGVIKNVIPAIASTNSIIAAETVLESIKLMTSFSKVLDNYFMYMGHQGIYSDHSKYEKKEDCDVCSKPKILSLNKDELLKDLLLRIKSSYNLSNPGLMFLGEYIYISSPEIIEEELRPRLNMTINELVEKQILPLQEENYTFEVLDKSSNFNLRMVL